MLRRALPTSRWGTTPSATSANGSTSRQDSAYNKHFPVLGYYGKLGFTYTGNPNDPSGQHVTDAFPELFNPGSVQQTTAAFHNPFCNML